MNYIGGLILLLFFSLSSVAFGGGVPYAVLDIGQSDYNADFRTNYLPQLNAGGDDATSLEDNRHYFRYAFVYPLSGWLGVGMGYNAFGISEFNQPTYFNQVRVNKIKFSSVEVSSVLRYGFTDRVFLTSELGVHQWDLAYSENIESLSGKQKDVDAFYGFGVFYFFNDTAGINISYKRYEVDASLDVYPGVRKNINLDIGVISLGFVLARW